MALLALLSILLLTQHGLASQEFNKTTHIPASQQINQPTHTPALAEISFSASIIHRDNPASPFYNPNLTVVDRMKSKIIRSKARHRYSKSLTDASLIVAPISFEEETGDYVMSYYIGNPPVQTFGIIDTGSSIVWLQCEPCEVCLKQRLPIFHPLNSSTYKFIMYEDPRCRWLPDGGRPNEWDRHTCMYNSGYADNSSSEGHLSTDTFWFDQQDSKSNISLESLPNVVFGCGIKNLEIYQEDVYPPGIIGLDRTNLSLVVQLGVSKFSYCLSSVKETKINFGSSALMIGDRIPLLNINDLYDVTMSGIAIQTYFDYEWLPIPPNAFDLTSEGGGGVIVDSGTPLSRLPRAVKEILSNSLEDRINQKAYYNDDDDLCFNATLLDIEASGPKVMFHFNGSELILSKTTLWTEDPEGWCIAVVATNSSEAPTVIGSYQLENHNVGYDLINNVLTLQPMDCSTNA